MKFIGIITGVTGLCEKFLCRKAHQSENDQESNEFCHNFNLGGRRYRIFFGERIRLQFVNKKVDFTEVFLQSCQGSFQKQSLFVSNGSLRSVESGCTTTMVLINQQLHGHYTLKLLSSPCYSKLVLDMFTFTYL